MVERGGQDDIWENWANAGVTYELKRATENALAVVYNLHKIKYENSRDQLKKIECPSVGVP